MQAPASVNALSLGIKKYDRSARSAVAFNVTDKTEISVLPDIRLHIFVGYALEIGFDYLL